ncbi:MAG: hypothetical protein M3Z92_09695 [Bacteroidota bacterium]|nr:hypothetical protein [Bacteroidota bacterium]
MILELNIISQQYSRMPDEELIRFAANESQHLTIESFHLLNLNLKGQNSMMTFSNPSKLIKR